MSMPKAGIRLRGKQPVKTTTQSLPVHHSKSKVRAATRLDGPIGADSPVPASAATVPELSPPNGNVVARVRHEMRAKNLEDLLVGIFGEPTYFRILAVALSWLERCSCASALPVKVCAAALLLTGINYEGAAPLRPCVPMAHLADHFQVRRSAIVQSMATLCNDYHKK